MKNMAFAVLSQFKFTDLSLQMLNYLDMLRLTWYEFLLRIVQKSVDLYFKIC